MREGIWSSFRMIAALTAMALLAFSALITLGGCGGGGTTGVGIAPTGLLVRGFVLDEQGRGVSGISIILSEEHEEPKILSGSDGSFSIDVGSGTAPTKFRVDIGSRANEYYEIVSYNGRTVQGCPLNLPAPQGNVIEVGTVTVYSSGTPPPPVDDICQ